MYEITKKVGGIEITFRADSIDDLLALMGAYHKETKEIED